MLNEDCAATKRTIILALLITSIYAACSTKAHAAEEIVVYAHPAPRYSAELKLLPTLILLKPGGAGTSGEFEARLSEHLALYASGAYSRSRISEDSLLHSQRQQAEPDGLAAETRTTGLGAGMRYYGSAFRDSWYVGGILGGATTNTNWAFADERLQEDSLAYTFGLNTGFRWLWASGLLVRAGFGLTTSTLAKRGVSELVTSSSEGFARAADNVNAKARTKNSVVATSLDLGVGWQF